jgi:phage-related protein
MSSVGTGVREIRIHQDGEFRVLYIARLAESVFVLHAFQKKSRKTPKREIELAADRFRAVVEELRRRRSWRDE